MMVARRRWRQRAQAPDAPEDGGILLKCMVRPRSGRVLRSQKSRNPYLQGLCSKPLAVGSRLGACWEPVGYSWLQLVSISVVSSFPTCLSMYINNFRMQVIPAPFHSPAGTPSLSIQQKTVSAINQVSHDAKSHSIHYHLIGRLAGLEVLVQGFTSQVAARYPAG